MMRQLLFVVTTVILSAASRPPQANSEDFSRGEAMIENYLDRKSVV
jgi:hypothetical protein